MGCLLPYTVSSCRSILEHHFNNFIVASSSSHPALSVLKINLDNKVYVPFNIP